MNVLPDSPGVGPAWQPLTEAQSGLWYAQRLAADGAAFHAAEVLWLRGPLRIADFVRSANQAAREAQALALAFADGPHGVLQCVDEQRTPWLEVVDFSGRPDAHAAARVGMQADLGQAVDPCRDALAAQRLFVLPDQAFAWYRRVHHLCCDGYGMALWARRVAELYGATPKRGGAGTALMPWQVLLDEDARYRHSERRRTDADHWRTHFQRAPRATGETVGAPAGGIRCHRAATRLSPEVGRRLVGWSQAHRLPWPDVLTALTALYVRRMGHPGAVGVPAMGRLGSAASRVVGTLMNVLPLPFEASPDARLHDWIAHTVQRLQVQRRHGRYRSEQLRRDLGRVGAGGALYGAIVNVQPLGLRFELPGVACEWEVMATGPVDDISLGFRGADPAALQLEIEAHPQLHSPNGVDAHLQRLPAFVGHALDSECLGDVPLATPAEEARHVFDENATAHAVPGVTLVDLMEATMSCCADDVAVEFEGARCTYAELDRRSGALAAELQRRGVVPGAVVAVGLPRSVELVVALVAVLRAGGAYLPLESTLPPLRAARMVALARPVCAVVHQACQAKVPAGLDLLPQNEWPAEGRIAPSRLGGGDPAYVIFTSGSTGDPKGVIVEHRAIVNRLEWMKVHYQLGRGARVLHKTPIGFDVSVWELFLPLMGGGTLVVAPPEMHRDARALACLLREARIDACHFVPSMLATFLAEPAARGLRVGRVFCSGEALGAALRDRVHATMQCELHNLYGPTEAAVDVSHWDAGPGDSSRTVPIGRPVWNTRLYVLDERLRALPPGVAGELCIGGMQLARGYAGRPDLTAERFVADPYRPGERLYRTGDLARRREDGALEFLGRGDRQVKLRGQRIELGDVEAAIAASGPVRRNVVQLERGASGHDRLVAYVQVDAGVDLPALREAVAARLPAWMLPNDFVALQDWPVTVNGKLDRARLAAVGAVATRGRPPCTDSERTLAELFAEVLQLPAGTVLGADADFFELGGDSLTANELLLLIERRWARHPGLGTVFMHPRIAALAAVMDAQVPVDAGLAPMICLHAGSPSRAPLFAVHPAGGLAWGYGHLARALARVGPVACSVHGLQAPALSLDEPLPSSLDELARGYADAVCEQQPRGTVHLLGWSVGGIIAQAMAVALQDRGRDVGMLALLDAYPAEVWRSEPEPTPARALRAVLAVAGHDPDGLADLVSRDQVIGFLERGGGPIGRLPPAVLDAVVRIVTHNNHLTRAHRHRPWRGTLTHVRAALDHAGRPRMQPASWTPHAARIDTIDAPFLHAQLTSPQASLFLAPLLHQRMQAHAAEPPTFPTLKEIR